MKLKKEKKYLIKYETILLEPVFNKYGSLWTQVREWRHSFIVTQKPKEIIEDSLLYYGRGDLNAATKVSRSALNKNVDMPPIMISRQHGLYWFPTQSPSKEDICIWIAAHHISNTSPKTSTETDVFFYNDDKISLPYSQKTTERKIYQAEHLQRTMEHRSRKIQYKQEINASLIKELSNILYSYFIMNKYKSGDDNLNNRKEYLSVEKFDHRDAYTS